MVALSEIANMTFESATLAVAVAALVATGTTYIRSNGRYRYDDRHHFDNTPELRPAMAKSQPGRR